MLLVELIGRVENRRIIHRDFGAKSPKTNVRPVTDLAISYAHQVLQAPARGISKINGLRAIRENESRSFVLIKRFANTFRQVKTLPGPRRVPGNYVAFRNENVRESITVQVYSPQIRVLPVNVWQGTKRREGLPLALIIAFIKSRSMSGEFN